MCARASSEYAPARLQVCTKEYPLLLCTARIPKVRALLPIVCASEFARTHMLRVCARTHMLRVCSRARAHSYVEVCAHSYVASVRACTVRCVIAGGAG